ncbi:MAG: c-type cytochrome, partial [Anaerolineae bacterium]
GPAGLFIVLFVVVKLTTGSEAAHALPEYASRTGEACSTCHVNPGGGGPRTLRGLLWAARGRPDQLPQLGNILVAPGVDDGAELYDIACAGCHGLQGEGLFGTTLVGSGLRESKIRSTIARGRERSGMPGYEGQFTEAQLDALVEFAAGIASGRIEPLPMSYLLPPAEFGCSSAPETATCGGN